MTFSNDISFSVKVSCKFVYSNWSIQQCLEVHAGS